tara:strand:- start:1980 stop:2177 length:198 start_codon:yes stop_codon:yes gene_type:complete
MNIKDYVFGAVNALMQYNGRDNIEYGLSLLDKVDQDIEETKKDLWKEKVRLRYRRFKKYAESKNK